MTTADRNSGMGSWRIRRRFMFWIAAFCMLTVIYCLYKNLYTTVAESAVTMAFITLAGIVGSYVFGASWEDINMVRHRKSKKNVSSPDTESE